MTDVLCAFFHPSPTDSCIKEKNTQKMNGTFFETFLLLAFFYLSYFFQHFFGAL